MSHDRTQNASSFPSISIRGIPVLRFYRQPKNQYGLDDLPTEKHTGHYRELFMYAFAPNVVYTPERKTFMFLQQISTPTLLPINCCTLLKENSDWVGYEFSKSHL